MNNCAEVAKWGESPRRKGRFVFAFGEMFAKLEIDAESLPDIIESLFTTILHNS
jgi:hypothetical protein